MILDNWRHSDPLAETVESSRRKREIRSGWTIKSALASPTSFGGMVVTSLDFAEGWNAPGGQATRLLRDTVEALALETSLHKHCSGDESLVDSSLVGPRGQSLRGKGRAKARQRTETLRQTLSVRVVVPGLRRVQREQAVHERTFNVPIDGR